MGSIAVDAVDAPPLERHWPHVGHETLEAARAAVPEPSTASDRDAGPAVLGDPIVCQAMAPRHDERPRAIVWRLRPSVRGARRARTPLPMTPARLRAATAEALARDDRLGAAVAPHDDERRLRVAIEPIRRADANGPVPPLGCRRSDGSSRVAACGDQSSRGRTLPRAAAASAWP